MNLFSKKIFLNQEVLIADGSKIDIRSLRLGSFEAQDEFLQFLTRLQDQLCALINSQPPENRLVVIQGLHCLGPPVFGVDHARGTDEIVCLRQRLRELLSELKLNQVNSLFIGKGHLCSPVTEIVQACLLRIWRPSKDLYFSSTTSFCDHLFDFSDQDSFDSSSRNPEMPWIKSLKNAQNNGLIDSVIDEIDGSNEYLINSFVSAKARPTQDRIGNHQSILTQLSEVRISEARNAFGNAKRYSRGNFKSELEAKAYREISYVRGSLVGSDHFGKTLRMNKSDSIVKLKPSEKFGIIIDLSDEILDPLLLERLAKMSGILILTAGSLRELEKRNSDLRSRFTQRFGGAAAAAFWEKNIVLAVASKYGMTPLSILKPTGTNSFELNRSDRMVVKIISDSSRSPSAQNNLTNQIFKISVNRDDSDWVDLTESWPEFYTIIRALDAVYISSQQTCLGHLKHLFYYLLAVYGFYNEWPSKGMMESVEALGLDSGCMEECFDSYSRSKTKSRRISFGRQSTESSAFMEEFIRYFAITFSGLVANDEETKRLILWMLRKEDDDPAEEIQPTIPLVRSIELKSEGCRTILSFKWIDSFDSEIGRCLQGSQLHSRFVRQQNISRRISDFIMGMEAEDRRIIEQAVGIQLSDCLPHQCDSIKL